MITQEEIDKAERLIGEDDHFKSQYPGSTITGEYSIGFLEELCEYVVCLTDLSYEDKLEKVLGIEDIIRKMLNGEFDENKRPMVRGGINYHPTWSKKLTE